MEQPIESLRKVRLEKLKKIRALKIDPYPIRSQRKYSISETLKLLGKTTTTAGRVTGFRSHGGSTFMDIVDESGKIQAYFKKDKLKNAKYSFLTNFDIGDFIEVSGKVFKTVAGETTIEVAVYSLLAKSLRPLPSSWHGLKDIEIRYRKRYLDLLLNPEIKNKLAQRTKIIQSLRQYLIGEGFLEVETPVLQPLYGGASARPFKTHHNALNVDFYLKIADELYLKRLIIGGYEKVFEIDTDFRNEGIDKTHLPEFKMLEAYQAYADYFDIMDLLEQAYRYTAQNALGTTKVKFAGRTIDFSKPWRRLTMYEAIRKYVGVDVTKLSDKQIKSLLEKHNLKYEDRPALTGVGRGFVRGIAIATLFELCEPHLLDPTIIYDYPKETTALCKPHRKDPDLIERFEPYIGGMEIGNAYSELNDPVLQLEFFKQQVEAKKSGDEEAHPMDDEFVEALEYGMPPTGGLGLGVDRMVMILTGANSLKEIIAFPTLKPQKVNND